MFPNFVGMYDYLCLIGLFKYFQALGFHQKMIEPNFVTEKVKKLQTFLFFDSTNDSKSINNKILYAVGIWRIR